MFGYMGAIVDDKEDWPCDAASDNVLHKGDFTLVNPEYLVSVALLGNVNVDSVDKCGRKVVFPHV